MPVIFSEPQETTAAGQRQGPAARPSEVGAPPAPGHILGNVSLCRRAALPSLWLLFEGCGGPALVLSGLGAARCGAVQRLLPPVSPCPRAGEPVPQCRGSGSCWQRFLVSISKGSVIKIAAAGMVQLQKLACVGLLAGCGHRPSLLGRRWWGTGARAPWAPVGDHGHRICSGIKPSSEKTSGLCRAHHGRWPQTPMCWEPLHFWQRDGVAASPASRVGRQQESPRSWRLLPCCGQISSPKGSQPEGCT